MSTDLGHRGLGDPDRRAARDRWRRMILRCTDPANPKYARYGGRGITVCQRWLASFDAFLSDVGPRPTGMTLDRIDNDGNYEPGNVRWATPVEQRANRETDPQASKTHCPQDHEYTEENTYVDPRGWRVCRICHREKRRRQRAERTAGVSH